jgi:hypothetical protein
MPTSPPLQATLIKNLTVNAAGLVPGLVDFVYVDARHDYCGVMEDIMVKRGRQYYASRRSLHPFVFISTHNPTTRGSVRQHYAKRDDILLSCSKHVESAYVNEKPMAQVAALQCRSQVPTATAAFYVKLHDLCVPA